MKDKASIDHDPIDVYGVGVEGGLMISKDDGTYDLHPTGMFVIKITFCMKK